eukprot:1642583-Amphidinium_carterae.1
MKKIEDASGNYRDAAGRLHNSRGQYIKDPDRSPASSRKSQKTRGSRSASARLHREEDEEEV